MRFIDLLRVLGFLSTGVIGCQGFLGFWFKGQVIRCVSYFYSSYFFYPSTLSAPFIPSTATTPTTFTTPTTLTAPLGSIYKVVTRGPDDAPSETNTWASGPSDGSAVILGVFSFRSHFPTNPPNIINTFNFCCNPNTPNTTIPGGRVREDLRGFSRILEQSRGGSGRQLTV